MMRLPADDTALVRIVDRAMEEAARRAGERLACRPGCVECCIGPFLITPLDAARLRAGLAALEESDAERAARLRERIAEAEALLAPHFDLAREEEFATRFAHVPCPVLNPSTGLCDLYGSRPITCRTFGPPVRFADDDPPPCRLCFTGASQQEVERCRVAVDEGGFEERLLARIEEPDTIVALAFSHNRS
jgi:Fe-S-cluster containining protein